MCYLSGEADFGSVIYYPGSGTQPLMPNRPKSRHALGTRRHGGTMYLGSLINC